MAKRESNEVSVRKPILVFGGVVLGVALLGFVLMTFVGGGGGDEAPAPSAPPKSAPAVTAPSSTSAPSGKVDAPGLRPGGRDPFQALVAASSGGGAPAPAAAPAPTQAASTSDSRYVALVKAGKCQALPANEPHTLEEVIAHQNECLAANPE